MPTWLTDTLKLDVSNALTDESIARIRKLRAANGEEWAQAKVALQQHRVLKAVYARLAQGGQALRQGVPVIHISADERKIANKAITIMSKRRDIYQRGGMLVTVAKAGKSKHGIERPDDAPRIIPASLPQVRSILADSIQWMRTSPSDPESKIVAHPPEWAYKDIHTRGEWHGMRPLLGISETPTLRPDGSVVEVAGYDEQTGIYFCPTITFPPIGDPTREDAQKAVVELYKVVSDFPFKEGTHTACWLAGVLTPMCRHAFDEPSPMLLFDANTRGSGKSLLTDTISTIVSGRPMARMTQVKDPEEERKRITSIALAGDPLVLIDNVSGLLGSAPLDAALSSTVWAERLLSSNERPKLPMLSCWYATGNNLQLRDDTARRCLYVRLESPLEHPEQRRGFVHSNLLRHIRENRGELVASALRILRAYCLAGRPTANLDPWGTFQPWSDLVREAIVWAGAEDPGKTRSELHEMASGDAQYLPALYDGIEEIARRTGRQLKDDAGMGITSAGLVKAVLDGGHPMLLEALENLVSKVSPQKLGSKLRRYRDRWVGNKCLRNVRADNISHWVITRRM